MNQKRQVVLISGYFRAIGVALDKKRLVTFTVGNFQCSLSAANLTAQDKVFGNVRLQWHLI